MNTAMRIVAARTGACLLVVIAAALAHAQTGKPVAAVWKERHVDFVYQGRVARYSCEGLRDKVRAMLLDLGARRDLKVTPVGCTEEDRLTGGSSAPALSIVFSAPIFPAPAVKALPAGDLAATDARFEGFTIGSDTFRNMNMNDCELVQEFTRQILPKLSTRAVREDIACEATPGGSRYLVRGEILRAVPGAVLPARTVR